MVKKYFLSVAQKTGKFKREFRIQATTALLAAFGFLIALVWRDFLTDSVNHLVTALGVTEQLYLYKLLSALIITIIAIIGISLVSRLKVKEEIKQDQDKQPKKSKK